MSDTRRRGKCPECGGIFSLRKTGRLRAHGYTQARYYASGPGCPGSGGFPVEAYTEEASE